MRAPTVREGWPLAAKPSGIEPKRVRRRGSTAIEFAIVMVCVVPLFFGAVAMGLTIGNGVEATQVTSDVGRMYGEGTDFTSAAAQQLVNSLAQGFTLTSTGNAVLILSQINTVFTADCTNASVTPCTNQGSPVFVQRVVIGNTSLQSSAFGTPPSQYIDSLGNISAANYMTQTSLVATGFGSVLAQSDGDVAYLVEGYFTMPSIGFLAPLFLGNHATTLGGFYVRAIF